MKKSRGVKEYLTLIDKQKQRREEEMKIYEKQINIQNSKIDKFEEGISVSDTESNMEDLNPSIRIENAIALLSFIIKNNIELKKLYFFEKFTLVYGNILLIDFY